MFKFSIELKQLLKISNAFWDSDLDIIFLSFKSAPTEKLSKLDLIIKTLQSIFLLISVIVLCICDKKSEDKALKGLRDSVKHPICLSIILKFTLLTFIKTLFFFLFNYYNDFK